MTRFLALLAGVLVLLSGPVQAQTVAGVPASGQGFDASAAWFDVQVGQSLVVQGQQQIGRVLLSDSTVAQVQLLDEYQFQIRGLIVGTTDLWIWYRDDSGKTSRGLPMRYQVSVHQDLADMLRRIGEVVGEGEPPRVYPMRGRLVLDGDVNDVETLERLAAIAAIYDEHFVNLMRVKGDHQVQLHVVFAEVSRTGLRELGLNALAAFPGWSAGLAGPSSGGSMSFRDTSGEVLGWVFPTVGGFQVGGMGILEEGAVAAFLGALEESKLSKTLAEPTLVALSGQKAEFLAGGEMPVPLVTANNVRIDFKEYGTKLSFVPTVLGGGVIDLQVYMEVSEVDDSVSVSLGSIAVPGLSTRKGSSHLRLKDGTTFAMAGLITESVSSQRSEIPVLGRIPIVGALFRYTRHEPEEREILIFVTPHLVRPLAPGEVPAPPTASEDNHPTDFELFLLGMDHRLGSRAFTGPTGMER
ncbi:MAG: pilus assembly protein N-terminal domain-containing protein [Deltaproteobacteria bacterium]|nr:pilus assembly protein N-terminal domain-containing protein [Deltaproteobacteria bacterium]